MPAEYEGPNGQCQCMVVGVIVFLFHADHACHGIGTSQHTLNHWRDGFCYSTNVELAAIMKRVHYVDYRIMCRLKYSGGAAIFLLERSIAISRNHPREPSQKVSGRNHRACPLETFQRPG